jgi:hypothetical protein
VVPAREGRGNAGKSPNARLTCCSLRSTASCKGPPEGQAAEPLPLPVTSKRAARCSSLMILSS